MAERRRPAPTASYRLQLTPTRGFDHARRQLDRLGALGISHLYVSPVTEAVPGSTHGYDVVDHARVRDELGGLDGLTALLDACADRDLFAVVDHVPNHAAIGEAERNRHWWALLRDGRGSAADRWFDVDWAVAGERVILPLLDRPLADLVAGGDVAVDRGPGAVVRVGAMRLPMAAGTESLPLLEALAGQHWELIEWREPRRNVRRFFTIDSLVALRVEHPEVAEEVDTVPRLLVGHPAFGGVRVDHVDGLADPLGYLQGLRELLGPDRWLIVEKILAGGETLPATWPVDGTTGYDHARVLEHALLDVDGWATLAARWRVAVGDARPFRAWELEARHEVLELGLSPDRHRVARVASTVIGPHLDAVGAVTELSAHLTRYRTYLPDDDAGAGAARAAAREAAEARPELAGAIEAIVAAVSEPIDDSERALRTRWQQLTGPATAKGVEDRAFWRYVPLASLGEVGGDPEPASGDPVAALHEHHAATSAGWPTTMLAGTTHDVARSEDVRAMGLVLATAARPWARVVDDWWSTGAFSDLDADIQWFALQAVATTPQLHAVRLETFLVKAAREAERHTAWVDPDDAYERRLSALAREVLAWPPIVELAASIDRPGRALAVGLLAVRVTAPGVADVYQGTEAFRFLLVDPDNRVPPDDAELDALVARAGAVDGRAAWAEPLAPLARAVVLRRLLALRRTHAAAFGPGSGYAPLAVESGGGVVAFARLDPSGTAVTVTAVSRGPTDAIVTLPPGRWRHVLVDEAPPVTDTLELGPALEVFPAVVLAQDCAA